MSAAFEASLRDRNASEYADFLLPHLHDGAHVLDAGCGSGTIALGLAAVAGAVVGVDAAEEEFATARIYAADHGIDNLSFRAGDIGALDVRADHFDACLCHSVLETFADPRTVLGEIMRVLKPGTVLGVACVEYGGLILAGPHEDLLRRFYRIRERVWLLEGAADPYRGRRLRGLLVRAGFERVVATSKYLSYGSPDAVRTFGLARGDDCGDGWYARSAMKHGLATAEDLDAMARAWIEWAESPDAYLAFAWCRALGWKPN